MIVVAGKTVINFNSVKFYQREGGTLWFYHVGAEPPSPVVFDTKAEAEEAFAQVVTAINSNRRMVVLVASKTGEEKNDAK